MFEKKTIIASAILAGLVSGLAFAEEPTTAPAGHENAHAKDSKPMKKKKGGKDACSGKGGCNGEHMDAKAAPKDAPKDAPKEAGH